MLSHTSGSPIVATTSCNSYFFRIATLQSPNFTDRIEAREHSRCRTTKTFQQRASLSRAMTCHLINPLYLYLPLLTFYFSVAWMCQQLTLMQVASILDNLFYNIIHDVCLNAHRDEKIAKANSAAILVELKAAETDPNTQGSDDEEDEGGQQPHSVETDAAKYVNGEVYLRGNPLQTIKEIRCPKCKLPRLLHPTDGNGARRPDPNIQYCKKPFFIEKLHYDIYGQVFQQEGPGRGKKKKDMINPLKASTPTGSQDSTPPPIEDLKPIQFPSSKCTSCGQHIPIKRMNNHMVKCIGDGGRNSSRNALKKIQNGSGSASANGTPPPGSRNGTPAPGTNGKRSSPTKRSPGADFDSEEPGAPAKKKKITTTKKNTVSANKLNLKAPPMKKSASTSGLSFELKGSDDEDLEEDGGDDDKDGEYAITVETKKKGVPRKIKEASTSGSKKKWKLGKGGKPAGGVGGTVSAVEIPGLMGGGVKKTAPAAPAAKVDKVERAESPDSSQTLSSPNC